jgi:predicted alpha/beta hydrolase family esterase
MKNALILHGTDFGKKQRQRFNNWFPWLKEKLEKLNHKVWVPELPKAWQPDLLTYWHFLKDFDFGKDSVLIGHSSGGATVFGLLHKLPAKKKIKLAISVAGFYKDEGWDCEGLFSEEYNWPKIRKQAKKIHVIWSPNDPYIKKHQTDYLCQKLGIAPTIFPDQGHFNLETSAKFKEFPELLKIIKER